MATVKAPQATEQAPLTATSRGWLAFFGLVLVVLLPMFALSLGLTVTVGTPGRVTAVVTRPPSLTTLQRDLDQQVRQAVTKTGIAIPKQAPVVPETTTKMLLSQGLAASVDFQVTMPLKEATAAITQQVATTKPLTKAQQQRVQRAVATQLDQTINQELLKTGAGAAYGFIVLTVQTAAIVTGILLGLVLLLMRATAHSWRLFLRVVGRITYSIGFLGGGLATVVANPALTHGVSFGVVLPAPLLEQLVASFAPSWQHVAGWVIVLGLLMAGVVYPLNKWRGPTAATDKGGPHGQSREF